MKRKKGDEHLLVDRCGLGHHEEALVAASGVKDVNSLKRHFLETGQVKGILLVSSRGVGEILQVVGIDVAVEPDGHVEDGEDTECLLVVWCCQHGGLVQRDGVAGVGELLVVVQALVGSGTRKELLGSSTENDIWSTHISPVGVIFSKTVELLIDQGTVLGPETSMAGQCNRSRICFAVSHVSLVREKTESYQQ